MHSVKVRWLSGAKSSDARVSFDDFQVTLRIRTHRTLLLTVLCCSTGIHDHPCTPPPPYREIPLRLRMPRMRARGTWSPHSAAALCSGAARRSRLRCACSSACSRRSTAVSPLIAYPYSECLRRNLAGLSSTHPRACSRIVVCSVEVPLALVTGRCTLHSSAA